MSKSKFTPGPWIVVRDHWDINVQCKASVSGLPFAVTPICIIEQEGEYGLFDARLIAAAPDMYEALNEMLSSFDPYNCKGDFFHHAAIMKARAAIAKAEEKT